MAAIFCIALFTDYYTAQHDIQLIAGGESGRLSLFLNNFVFLKLTLYMLS